MPLAWWYFLFWQVWFYKLVSPKGSIFHEGKYYSHSYIFRLEKILSPFLILLYIYILIFPCSLMFHIKKNCRIKLNRMKMFNETRYRWMHKNYLYIILIVTVCSSPENWPLLNFPFHWIVTKERSQKQKELRYVHFSTRWKKLETIVIRGLIRSLLDRCTGWNFIIPRRMDICSTLDDRSISFSFLLIFCLSSPLPRLDFVKKHEWEITYA